MHKLIAALALATAVVAPGAADSRQLHRWGDFDWQIIRWAYGDCKIWFDSDGPPLGGGWVVLADNIPTYQAAWGALLHFKRLGACA